MPSNNVIFISYASEDYPSAKRLYDYLKNAGLNPWLDKENLRPGENIEITIKNIIKTCNYFIPLLSSISTKKRGDVQKELNFALNVLDEIPESDIFVIPVRLDDCEIIYDKLKKYTSVDLFDSWEKGLQKILISVGGFIVNNGTSKPKDDQWLNLLKSIKDKTSIPIIGSEATFPWMRSLYDISIEWANEHGYPFENKNILSEVSQFLAIKYDDEYSPKRMLCDILREISIPVFSTEKTKNTVYSVLADLNLPIYITTNYDHFMEETLKSKGKEPVSEFCRWSKWLKEYTESVGISSVFDNRQDFVPTEAKPLIFHLYGDIDIPESILLTENDFLNFIAYLNVEKNMLPKIIKQKLIASSLLFLGVGFNDQKFRLVWGSIINYLNIKSKISNIYVLKQPPLSIFDADPNSIQKYLNEYIKISFKSRAYWNDLFTFSTQLRQRWNDYRSQISNNKGSSF
jgi:hypothetical protein